MRLNMKFLFRHSFTLIELLLVISVVAIMLGIGASLLLSSGQGGAVKQSTVMVGSTISSARTLARTKRIYTAVVFPVTDQMPNGYANRSCIVVEVEPVSGSRYVEYKLKKIISGQGWRLLPPGTFIGLGEIVEQEQANESASEKPNKKVTLMPLSAGPLLCRFSQGEWAGKIEALTYAPTRSQIFDIPDGTPCLVYRPGGQLEVSSLGIYQTIYVAEGSVNNNAVKTRKDGSYRQIYINPFTGKVQYEF